MQSVATSASVPSMGHYRASRATLRVEETSTEKGRTSASLMPANATHLFQCIVELVSHLRVALVPKLCLDAS